MTQRAPGRKSSLIALTAFAVLLLGALAPAALAQVTNTQIPGGDAVGTVTETVTDTVSGGGDGGSGGGGGPAGTVTETVTETVKETGSSAPGGVGTVVDNTGNTVKETGTTVVDQTKKTVDNTASDTGTAVNNAINSAGDAGGTVTNPLLNAKSPRNADRDGDGKVSRNERTIAARQANNRKAAYQGESAGDRASRKGSDDGKAAALAAEENRRRNSSPASPTYAEAPERETFITQLTQAATEAAEKLAFPLGLALMVGAFLMVQGRIDRKDAKLVLAPIDSEQDLLSFQ